MYPSSGTTIRGDLNTVVEEASASDRFYIGERVLPMFGVDKKSGNYPKLKKTNGELLKPGSTIRQPKTEYGKVNRSWDTDTYDCVDRGLEEAVDDAESKDLARWFNAESTAAKLVLRSMKLDYEIRVQALVQNNATFPGTNSVVAYTNALIATIDFPQDLLLAIERVNDNAEIADTVVMSPNVFNRIILSTKLQNFIRGSRPNDAVLNITAQTLADAFSDNGIRNVLIGRARYDSAKKGQAYAAARVWNDTYVWVGAVKGGDFMEGGTGRSIVWNEEGGLWVTESYRDDKIRSNMVRVRQNTTEKIINADAGTMITTQYA